MLSGEFLDAMQTMSAGCPHERLWFSRLSRKRCSIQCVPATGGCAGRIEARRRRRMARVGQRIVSSSERPSPNPAMSGPSTSGAALAGVRPLMAIVRCHDHGHQETIPFLGGNITTMKVATGTVVDGKVVVEGETLPEGETVTVLLRENAETFELTPGEENELLESIASIERGEFISGEQLLERLRRFG